MRTPLKIQTLLFALILMVCIPFSSRAVDGQRKLTQPVPPATFPIVINQAGSYVLTSNLVVTDPNLHAIEITVNDVTIDLNGHKIQGPNTGTGNGHGIYALERYSIVIKNGRIWGFGQRGIFLSSTTANHPTEKGAGHIIENIQATNNTWGGIRINAGLVINCTTNNNGINGYISPGIDALNSTVSHCTANNNTGEGIEAYHSTITQCTTNYNVFSGIHSERSIIKNCSACNNESHGIYSLGNSYILENNLRDNHGWGLLLANQNGNAFAIKNVASGSGTGNFHAEPGNYMPLTGDNANYGF